MQLVIDISEEDYQNLKVKDKFDDMYLNYYEKLIVRGTPLPKHGRLIDADAIEYTHAIARCLEDGHNWNELCVTENELYDAPTIIGADRTESEG